MATHYLYGTILTNEAVAANNRGDNIGNTTTLQKVFHKDDLHTSVSGEAIRFALRYRFQLEDLPVNRTYNQHTGKIHFVDSEWIDWDPQENEFVDDDLMGFMNAAAAKSEGEDVDDEANKEEATEENKKAQKGKRKKKGKAYKHTSPLAVGRAVSLRPYRGELSYNAASRKEREKNKKGEGEASGLSLYSAEIHTTEYQYSFGLNLNDVIKKENIGYLIDAILDPPPVAGNHARFAYDFSPASIVLRVTKAHSSKIQNCFDHDEESRGFTVKRLIDRVESGDLTASELFIGGELADTHEGEKLRTLGASVHKGVGAAAREARRRIAEQNKDFAAVGPK